VQAHPDRNSYHRIPNYPSARLKNDSGQFQIESNDPRLFAVIRGYPRQFAVSNVNRTDHETEAAADLE
jgi:hypothetical protein